jgi:hypothetical protein
MKITEEQAYVASTMEQYQILDDEELFQIQDTPQRKGILKKKHLKVQKPLKSRKIKEKGMRQMQVMKQNLETTVNINSLFRSQSRKEENMLLKHLAQDFPFGTKESDMPEQPSLQALGSVSSVKKHQDHFRRLPQIQSPKYKASTKSRKRKFQREKVQQVENVYASEADMILHYGDLITIFSLKEKLMFYSYNQVLTSVGLEEISTETDCNSLFRIIPPSQTHVQDSVRNSILNKGGNKVKMKMQETKDQLHNLESEMNTNTQNYDTLIGNLNFF